jgi:hypothetical protein
MKKSKQTPAATSPSGWRAIALIAVVLGVLFWRSFLPDYVFFSNDGPLGVQNAAWLHMPGAMIGMWVDLNYLGSSGGAYTPGITAMLHYLLPPIGFAKFYPLMALFVLGLGAWTFFQQLKLSPLACLLGALAATLNSTFFSAAAWGVASQEIAAGMIFFALALIVGSHAEMPRSIRWTRLILAGLCVGVNVMEAADIGALYSVLAALFVFFHALAEGEGELLQKAFRGAGRVFVVAAFAGFIAFQAVLSLVGFVGVTTQGTSDTKQDFDSQIARWDWATQFSLPKSETFGLLVPGLFGYKMDTPKDMQPSLQDAYLNGVYWGGMGRTPALDRYFDGGSQGERPSGPGVSMRFTGGGNYSGILVLLVAGWAIAQSLRGQNSIFAENQKRMIWFWAVVMLFCLLFSWGRFAPLFYGILYKLPYFSSIRNPAKFLNFFAFALVIVFAYGVHALNRRYLDITAMKPAGLGTQIKNWWAKASSFDRKWTFASVGILVACVLGWLIYIAQKPALIQYIQKIGFPGTDPAQPDSAAAIAEFSIGQAAWFLVLLAIAIGLLLLVITGYFNGPRAKIGALLLGGLLLFDLGRANLPWLVDWDYKQKYEIGSLNPIVEFLRNKPYEQRIATLPFEPSDPQKQLRGYDYLFGGPFGLYNIEWMQQQFPYYNIQSLDIVQMPRTPADIKAFKEALAPYDQAHYPLIAREWMLTSTRYLLGAVAFLGSLNQELDPGQQRFRIVQRFDVVPKPGILHPRRLEEMTAVPNNDGDLALFEFTGALPRAKVYSSWQVKTNDQTILKTLADLNFDPARTVLISAPAKELPTAATNENSGSVEYQSYQTKHIVLSARTTSPSVLLLNDKFDPQWTVTVDGNPAELLRANFIMRGVYLPTAGEHTVDFRFSLPHRPLYVTLAAMALGIGLCGFLAFASLKGKSKNI